MALSFQDAQLLRRARNGDGVAALRLFERHGGAIYNLALGVLGVPHKAEDTVGLVAADLQQKAGTLSLTRPVRPQLLQLTAACLRRELGAADAEALPSPPADGDAAEAWRRAGAAMEGRPLKERLAFYTWAATNVSLADAARALGQPLDEYQRTLQALASEAGYPEPSGRGPLLPGSPTTRTLDAVEQALFHTSEGAGTRVASGRRHRRVRKKTAEERGKGLSVAWLSLLVALGVILATAWALDRRVSRERKAQQLRNRPTPSPSPIPTQWDVEIQR